MAASPEFVRYCTTDITQMAVRNRPKFSLRGSSLTGPKMSLVTVAVTKVEAVICAQLKATVFTLSPKRWEE